MRAAKKKSARVSKALAESVSPHVAKHSTYTKRMVYIPPTESNDNAGYFHVSYNVDINLMDSWMLDASIFDRSHMFTAHRCRALWDCMPRPSHRVENGENEKQAKAAATLAKLKRLVGPDWAVFENSMRWNEPLGYPGSRLANQPPEQIAAAKVIVRRVLEMIR